MMKISVLGTGYVGLVSGICLASRNHQVRCFDTNPNTINILDSGKCHIYEKGLDDLFKSSSNNISFHLIDDKSQK